MTRDERLLTALARMEDMSASTVALADLASLPERTARHGLRALIGQGLVWCPVRGLWRLTPAGRELAASLTSAAEPHREDSLARMLWRDGLGALLKHSRDDER